MIYLDYNATTKIFPHILQKIQEVYQLGYVNPFSVHQVGKLAKKHYIQAKNDILTSLNANDDYDLVFCSSGTEANNLALNGKKAVCSTIEHESIYNQKHVLKAISVNENGIVNIDDFIKSANESECISVMWANNLTGVVQNIPTLLEYKENVFFHTDAVQYAGKRLIDLKKTPVDAITISGHKIHGPHGVSALVYKKNFPITPMIVGGMQENEYRAGTHNLPAIVGFAEALKFCNNNEYISKYIDHTSKLKKIIIDSIKKNNGIVISENADCVSNTICIAKNGSLTTEQLMFMDINNICVSAGSACSAGITEKNHVLKSMNLGHFSNNIIRVSLDLFTTNEDVEKFCNVWKMI